MGSATTNFYNDAFKRGGWEAAGARSATSLGLQESVPKLLPGWPPEIVIQANLLGDTEMVRNRIRAYKDAGVTTLRVAPAGATSQRNSRRSARDGLGWRGERRRLSRLTCEE